MGEDLDEDDIDVKIPPTKGVETAPKKTAPAKADAPAAKKPTAPAPADDDLDFEID